MWSLLAAMSIAPAALAIETNIEADETVDFAKFKTFVVREGHLESKSPALNSELTKKRIQSGIEKALIAKGLTVATGQADLAVSFEFGSARTIETKAVPAGARGMGTRVINVPQSEGTLVIEIHDSATNSLVWHSTTSDSERNPIKLSEELDDMVKKSFGKYPPKKKK